jgi:hypothetical protein
MKKLACHDDFIALPAFVRAGLMAKTAGKKNRSEGQRQENLASPRGRAIRRHRSIG